jgi:hypothetical protein
VGAGIEGPEVTNGLQLLFPRPAVPEGAQLLKAQRLRAVLLEEAFNEDEWETVVFLITLSYIGTMGACQNQ